MRNDSPTEPGDPGADRAPRNAPEPGGAGPSNSEPGDVAGIPKLVIRYPSRVESIEALLPPGMKLWGEPLVQIGVYCVPVRGEPEFGVSTKIPATWAGTDGWYTLGIGIDQEAAIFTSRETNGQPKFPCEVRYFRLGEKVEAACTHQGYTFLTYRGAVTGERHPGEEIGIDEWWIKVSPATGGAGARATAEQRYDFPPRIVRVHTEGTAARIQTLSGDLELHHSPWDPYLEFLPPTGEATAELLNPRFTARSITLDDPLDPEAFWDHVDTIGGSRWPGSQGGPRS